MGQNKLPKWANLECQSHLGNHKISQGCSHDLSSSVRRNRYPPSTKNPGDRCCHSPIQSDASTEGAWSHPPRSSAWVLGNHKISQGCRPDLSSSVRRNRSPPLKPRRSVLLFPSSVRREHRRCVVMPTSRPSAWVLGTIRFLRAAAPIYLRHPGDRCCIPPTQSDASTEGAWSCQPRPSAWGFGETIKDLLRAAGPDLCSSVSRNRYPPSTKTRGLCVVMSPSSSQTPSPPRRVRGRAQPRPSAWVYGRHNKDILRGLQARLILFGKSQSFPPPLRLPAIWVPVLPTQSDASTEGAWLYQPRPSAWVLGNHKISQGCRPD